MAEHTAERVTLARFPSGVEIATSVHAYAGRGDGPTVYVQAAQHGQEINGTEVLRRIHDRLVDADLSGRVVAVPVADPLTFDRAGYTTPEALDGQHPNMNRVWPGDADGSLHQRMTARLWEFVADADAVVDLHTGSPLLYPHVVYREGDADARTLAGAFGTDLLLAEAAGDDAAEEWHRRRFDGKLRVAAAREGIPSITPELASNRRIIEDAVELGVEGVLAVLRHLGMLPGEAPAREQTVARNHLGRIAADASGLFRANADLELGSVVPRGADVGTVYDPTTYEPLHEATTNREGVLYAHRREATVSAGDQLASVAIVRE